jgi:hypothetical protein
MMKDQPSAVAFTKTLSDHLGRKARIKSKSAGEAEDYLDNLSSQCIHTVGYFVTIKEVKKRRGKGQEGFYPVTQFEKL